MNVVKEKDKRAIVEACLTSKDILLHYFGPFRINGVYNSPLRNDNTPSFSPYLTESLETKFKDFGTGKIYGGIDFVMELYHLDFNQALTKICQDFNLSDETIEVKKAEKQERIKEIAEKKDKLIQIIPKQFTEKDIEFWKSFGISNIDTLKEYNVYSISKAWIDKKLVPIKKGELAFCFYFPKTNHSKLYFPERKKGKENYKWFSNTTNDADIQGYWQCNPKVTKPNLLILTKSLKEIMFFRERGIWAIAINGEAHHFAEDFIRHLKKYCKNIKVFYDTDKVGLEQMAYLSEEQGFESIIMPKFECSGREIKDPTDAYKYCDKEKVEEFINSLKS